MKSGQGYFFLERDEEVYFHLSSVLFWVLVLKTDPGMNPEPHPSL